jgi:hypothetical protein
VCNVPLYSFVCCVLFERGMLFCVIHLFVCVSYCSTAATGKNPFAVQINNIIQTNSGAHLASYLLGTRGSFPIDKVAGT